MDPYYEQQLRDEVIYLHSLWHKGPPRSNPNNIPTILKPSRSRTLQPSNPPRFKKEKNSRRGRKGRGRKNKPPKSGTTLSASDIEWPCETPAQSEVQEQPGTSSWPNFNPKSDPTTQPLSAEDQAKVAANKFQQNALKAIKEFFASNVDSDGDDHDSEEEDNDEDGCSELDFFLKLFMEDGELRGYYEKNYEKGEFMCLVCGGIGKNVKRFKNCVALVQHSNTVANAKKKRAHRAFGQVICKVLGWSTKLASTLFSSLHDPLDQSGNTEVPVKGDGVENLAKTLEENERKDIVVLDDLKPTGETTIDREASGGDDI